MKKLLKLIGCFSLCTALVACSSNTAKVDEAALDDLIQAVEKFNEVSSANYDAVADISANEEAAQFKVHGAFINAEETPQVSMVLDLSSDGESMEKFVEFYSTDNNSYISLMGMKQKTANDESINDVEGILNSPEENGFTKEKIKEYLVSASKDGNTIHLVFDSKKILGEEVVKENLKTLTINAFEMDIVVEDGFINKLDFNLDATNTDTKENAKITGTLTVSQINEVTSIDFPDFSDYSETPIFE